MATTVREGLTSSELAAACTSMPTPSSYHNDPTRPTVTQSAGSRVSFSLWKSKNWWLYLQMFTAIFGAGSHVFFFCIETAGSEDKNRLSGRASPVVFILKAMRINLICVLHDLSLPLTVKEEACLETPSLPLFSPLVVRSYTAFGVK